MKSMFSGGAFGLVAIGALAWGCSDQADDCAANLNCGPSGNAGTTNAGASGRGGSSGTSGASGRGGGGNGGGSNRAGAGGGSGNGGSSSGAAGTNGTPNGGNAGESGSAGAPEPPCDASKKPNEESCLVNDAHAVFVAPTGDDTASGGKDTPVKSIAKAVELAGSSAKFVVACDGTYDEQVVLTTGAKLYGGFACPGSASATPWSYETGKRAKVAPSARGYALKVAAGSAVVAIEDFEFDARDGVMAGESSVAAFVNASTAVTFTRVALVAGKGVDGANGTRTDVAFPGQSVLNGKAAMGDLGGAPEPVICPVGGTTKGGKGGDGGQNLTGGGPGIPDLGAGQAGTVASCGAGGTGKDGASAAPQPPALGAASFGTISSTVFSGTAGGNGAPGTPGQGGGGGTGAASGGGGAGGAGGCGGAPGTGGKAGGSSIALLALNSTITLNQSQLTMGNAGKGGDGVAGQAGQVSGGNGGVQVPAGCQGGAGGAGGKGGAGGGAAGGLSVGIVYQGTKPTIDAMTTAAIGLPGAKGIGGVPGTNDGIAGLAQDTYLVP